MELTSQPTGDVTVEVTGATSGISVSPSTWRFTTSNWHQAETVTVSAAEDSEDSPVNESVTLMNEVSGGGYNGVQAASVAVTVIDNDAAGVVVSPTALEVGEGGRATYSVELTGDPEELPTGTVRIENRGYRR